MSVRDDSGRQPGAAAVPARGPDQFRAAAGQRAGSHGHNCHAGDQLCAVSRVMASCILANRLQLLLDGFVVWWSVVVTWGLGRPNGSLLVRLLPPLQIAATLRELTDKPNELPSNEVPSCSCGLTE